MEPPVLQRRVTERLYADPALDTARVRVTVAKGRLVVLDGAVHTYADKCSIEELVRRMPGVANVRNQLQVRLTIGDYRTDATLQRVIHDLLDSLARMPVERPRVTVANGWVTLEGRAEQAFQKELIERAVREVAGVRGIANHIDVPGERRNELRPPPATVISSASE